MKEFFETTEFGQKLKQIVRKTSQQYHGPHIYAVTEKLPKYHLKKGNTCTLTLFTKTIKKFHLILG